MVEQRVEKRADFYGFKEANLPELELVAECLSQKSGLSFKVPPWVGLMHELIYTHVSQFRSPNSLTFDQLYQEYCQLQSPEDIEKGVLNPAAAKILEKIRHFVLNAFTQNILNIDPELLSKIKDSQKLMVRSSGKEDNKKIANPGGNESCSNVINDPVTISHKIGEVVASYFSEKSIMQRLLCGDDVTSPPFMPVLLQEMIGISADDENCVRSGVIYARVCGTKIQVAPGHGELIVNSRGPFDTHFVSSDLIQYANPQEKPLRVAPSDNGLTIIRNKSSMRFSQSVNDSVILRLALIGQAIKEHYGDDRDIEFVYDPKIDEIYIVQSRPIPAPLNNAILPSSIPPQKLNKVRKEAKSIEKGVVVTPAENAAMIITSLDQIIVRDTIVKALDEYQLEMTFEQRKKVKAIIIKQEAPDTGHEAAQFNACSLPVITLENSAFITTALTSAASHAVAQFSAASLPVLAVSDINKTHDTLKRSESVIIVDPQRSQVIDWQCSDVGEESLNVYLFDKEHGILQLGLFKSSMPSRQFVETFSLSETEMTEFRKIIEIMGSVSQGNRQSNVSDLIERIEAADCMKENKDALHALIALMYKTIQFQKFISHSLFQKIMQNGLNIYNKIRTISACEDETIGVAHKQELLDLASLLSGIIYYPGKRGILSSSANQELSRRKLESQARALIRSSIEKKNHPTYNMIRMLRDSERFSFFVDILKFRNLTANQFMRSRWDEFVIALSQYPMHTMTLAKLLSILENQGLSAEWINKLFTTQLSDHCVTTLKNLVNVSNSFLEEIDRLALTEADQLIREWESKISEWADPAKFDHLYSGIKKILYLVDSLSLDRSLHEFTQIKIQNLVRRLTDLIDQSVKSLKGSPKYATDEMVKMRALYIIWMLEPMRVLMHKWVGYQRENPHCKSSKSEILQAISDRFVEICNLIKSDDFSMELARWLTLPGSEFTVDNALYQEYAGLKFKPDYFDIHFLTIKSKVTLEDLYTYMHQLILNALPTLAPVSKVDLSNIIPMPMQKIKTIFSETTHHGSDYGFGKVSCHGPFFRDQDTYCDIICTLGKHDYRMKVNCNSRTNMISLLYEIRDGGGGNEHNRYTDIGMLIKCLHIYLSQKIIGFKVIASKTEFDGISIGFHIAMPIDQCADEVISLIHDAISKMAVRTYGESARLGKLFFPDQYQFTSHDLFALFDAEVSQYLVYEVAAKIKHGINDTNQFGKTLLIELLTSKRKVGDGQLVNLLLRLPMLNLHQASDQGLSLLECVMKTKDPNSEVMCRMILAAMHHDDIDIFRALFNVQDKRELAKSVLNIFMNDLYNIEHIRKTNVYDQQYLDGILNFYLTLCKGYQYFEELLLLVKDEKIDLSEITALDKLFGNHLTTKEMLFKKVKLFIEELIFQRNFEGVKIILNSPLCNAKIINSTKLDVPELAEMVESLRAKIPTSVKPN